MNFSNSHATILKYVKNKLEQVKTFERKKKSNQKHPKPTIGGKKKKRKTKNEFSAH